LAASVIKDSSKAGNKVSTRSLTAAVKFGKKAS
jgi:hypothetical protein